MKTAHVSGCTLLLLGSAARYGDGRAAPQRGILPSASPPSAMRGETLRSWVPPRATVV
jgi:hypothetical protein